MLKISLLFVLSAVLLTTVCADPLGPPARFVVEVVTPGVAKLSWHSPLDDDDHSADKYTLQKSDNPHFKEGTVQILLDSKQKSYEDNECAVGETHYYRVAAHNDDGYGQWSTTDLTMTSATPKPESTKDSDEKDGSDKKGSVANRGFKTPCPLDCSGNGVCQHSTQECRCVAGFIGAACNVADAQSQSQQGDDEDQTDGTEENTSSNDDGNGDSSDAASQEEPEYCNGMCGNACSMSCHQYCPKSCPRKNTAPLIICTSKCSEGTCSDACSKMCAEQCPEVGKLSLTDPKSIRGPTRTARPKVTVTKVSPPTKAPALSKGKSVVDCVKRVNGECMEFKWNIPDK